jgi:hypothetical protein
MFPLSALIYSENGGSCSLEMLVPIYETTYYITTPKKVSFLQAVTFFSTLHDEDKELRTVTILYISVKCSDTETNPEEEKYSRHAFFFLWRYSPNLGLGLPP